MEITVKKMLFICSCFTLVISFILSNFKGELFTYAILIYISGILTFCTTAILDKLDEIKEAIERR